MRISEAKDLDANFYHGVTFPEDPGLGFRV